MKRLPSAYFSIVASALVALLAGCADLNDTGLAVLATRVSAHAIVNEQLVQGEMTLFADHTGTVTLRGQTMPSDGSGGLALPAQPPSGKLALNSCVGRLRYTATNTGSIDLRCNDGSVAELRMALIGESRGYGYGHTATGLVSLTFGLTAVEARAHLTVPANRQLVEGTDSSSLELR